MRAPERAEAQVEEDRNNDRGRPECPVVAGAGVANACPPERRRKDDDRQEKEDACDLKPKDAAHPANGAQKSADALRGGAPRLGHHPAGILPRRTARYGRRMHGLAPRNSGSADALPCYASRNAYADA